MPVLPIEVCCRHGSLELEMEKLAAAGLQNRYSRGIVRAGHKDATSEDTHLVREGAGITSDIRDDTICSNFSN